MAETFFYMTTIGRKTGNPHKIEIWFVEYEGCFYLCNGGDSKGHWVLNIEKTPQVTYYTAQSKSVIPDIMYQGYAQILTHETTLAAVKSLFDAKYKWSDGIFVQICPTS